MGWYRSLVKMLRGSAWACRGSEDTFVHEMSVCGGVEGTDGAAEGAARFAAGAGRHGVPDPRD